jgi:hypothetical protein
MPLELLLDCLQPVIELLRFGVELDEFGHECGQCFVTQSGGVILGDWCGETSDAAERAIAYNRLVLRDQSATASTGAIKLLRTLRT